MQDNIAGETGVGDTAGLGFSEDLDATDVDLTDKLYVIAPADLNLVEPAGLNEVLQQALHQNVLVYVGAQTDEALSLQITLAGADGGQDPCEDVRSLPVASWQNPAFSAGPGEVSVSFGGQSASLRDLTMSGVFDADAQNWREGTLSAELDARELQAALGDGDACDLLESLGSGCSACDDGAEQCFEVRFEDVVATLSSKRFDASPTCE